MSSDLKESVVLITSSNPDIRRFGTGFIIHQDEHATYLLTCMHVIEDVGGLQMVKAGGISATVIASGEKDGLDLAVLGVEGLLDKPTLNLYVFGENGSPLVAAGFQEFAKGFLIRPIRGTLCEEVGLEYRDKADRIKAWELKINNDYSLRPGYSGAPVIDEVNGYVLGVISHREGEKKGIAISIEAVEKIWTEIPSDLIIKNQKQLIELQHKRISTGLKQQRQQIIEENKCRINQKRRRVVGQRPIDVANYFRNRQREQEEIGRLLAAPSTRLVSVVGRGGMGKTALASKVLSDLERNRWPHTDDEIPVDGIVYLSTRTAGISLERLFIYCARMLGGKQEKALVAVWTNPKIATGDKVLLLLEALSQGLYVIMMDNIEDLLDDDGQIIDEDLQIFFEKCFVTLHNARLIVTSRIRLAFRHEVMRFDHQVPLIEGLPTEDGVALLRELDPNGIHGLREASDKELIKVVELVHGVPRAIEVFAGILANDPFANLDEVLQQFYGRDDVVQDLIEEGYKRLDNNACRVMEALSVFGCPVPVLAVDYLLEPFVPALDVPTIARRLIRTHFVSINRGSKTLSLHPIDRDYTYSQLPEEGDYNKKALEHRAAKYYAQLRVPKEAWQTIDDLEPQLAEFEHLVKGGDYVAAALLMNEIDAEYLSLWGYAQRVSNMRKKLLDKITDRELEISNLCNLGGAHVQLGQDREAINYLKQALEIAREIGNKNEEIRSIVQLGHSHKNLGEHEYAIECQQQALALARKIGDQQAEWQALDKLGVIYRNKGLPDKVIQYCQNALVITQQIGNRQGEGSVMENIGIAYRNMKHYDKAHDHLQLALKIAQEGVNRKAEARAFVNLGLTLVYMGKIEDAVDKLQNGISICEEIDYPRFQGFAYESFGLAYLSMQRYKEALENFQKALKIQNDIGNLIGQMQAILGLGDIYWKKGQNEKAIEHIRKALTIAHKLGNQTKEGECLSKLGDIHVEMEQYNQAIDYYQQSRTIFEGISEKKHLVEQVDLKITKVYAKQSISGCE